MKETNWDFLYAILKNLKFINYNKDDLIYSIGDHALLIYFIKKGEVILKNEAEKLFKYSAGEMFGDSDVLLNLLRDTTAVANDNTTLIILHKDDLNKLLLIHPEISY